MAWRVIWAQAQKKAAAALPLPGLALAPAESAEPSLPGLELPAEAGRVLSDTLRIVRGQPAFLARHVELLRDEAQARGFDADVVDAVGSEGFSTHLERVLGGALRSLAPRRTALARIRLSLGAVSVLHAEIEADALRPAEGLVVETASETEARHWVRTLTLRRDGQIGRIRDERGIAGHLFWFDGEALCTAALGADPRRGVLRGLVLEGWPGAIRVAPVGLDALQEAQAAWVVDPILGAWPVRRLGGLTFKVHAEDDPLVRFVRMLWVRETGAF